jgi:hypothetical protein
MRTAIFTAALIGAATTASAMAIPRPWLGIDISSYLARRSVDNIPDAEARALQMNQSSQEAKRSNIQYHDDPSDIQNRDNKSNIQHRGEAAISAIELQDAIEEANNAFWLENLGLEELEGDGAQKGSEESGGDDEEEEPAQGEAEEPVQGEAEEPVQEEADAWRVFASV